jgi:hypothetical protein
VKYKLEQDQTKETRIIFMVVIKTSGFWAGLSRGFSQFYYLCLVIIALFSFLPAFPNIDGFGRGLFLAYMPFLFMGVGFWLYETEKIKISQFIFLMIWVSVNYFYLTCKFVPVVLERYFDFAILGFILFTTAWYFQKKIKTPIILVFSNLTYSVYLFHNWLFDFFKNYLVRLDYQTLLSNIGATLMLFSFCFLIHKLLEKPANKLGSKIVSFYTDREIQ